MIIKKPKNKKELLTLRTILKKINIWEGRKLKWTNADELRWREFVGNMAEIEIESACDK